MKRESKEGILITILTGMGISLIFPLLVLSHQNNIEDNYSGINAPLVFAKDNSTGSNFVFNTASMPFVSLTANNIRIVNVVWNYTQTNQGLFASPSSDLSGCTYKNIPCASSPIIHWVSDSELNRMINDEKTKTPFCASWHGKKINWINDCFCSIQARDSYMNGGL